MSVLINKSLKDYNLEIEESCNIKQFEEYTVFKAHKLTAHTKTRAEVNYSTKKLYKQKGTGRARSGSRKSPLKKGGGIIFGPRNRQDKLFKINKTYYTYSLISLLNYISANNEVKIVSNDIYSVEKTKDAIKALDLDLAKNYVYLQKSFSYIKGIENLSNVAIYDLTSMNIEKIFSSKYIFLDEDLLLALQGVIDNVGN